SPRPTLFPYPTLFRSVVEVLESLDQPHQGRRLLLLYGDEARGSVSQLGAVHLHAVALERSANSGEVARLADDFERVLVGAYVVRSEEHTSELLSRFDL